ncbi:ABC transporter permease [Opitutus sp. GAS368]|uniref:ABC transporter permease n=1 Tax=Opitutus sp. GAS368 TaxID=1882749 RepID=UPI00087BADBB|nr:ABC transporter permease [Opitutus sp. GAS368]SDS27563.1 lipopolysaccharide transport system permease protein [Opitutus sp. GAS368]
MLRRLLPFAADLWTHRELLWQFTLRNVELRHKGSHLGLIWSILNPLLMLGLYVLVFGFIFGGKYGVSPNETRLDYALGIFLGLTLFHFVAEVLGVSSSIIVGNPNFVKKVVFPLEILPAANVGGALFHLLISLGLALLSLLLFGHGIPAGILWLPVIIFPLVLLGLGLAWLISALGVFFRDIGQVMQFLSTALMWASAVFFTAQKYPTAWTYLRFNPLLLAIDLTRDAALWARPLNYHHLGYLYLTGFAACYLGHLAFKRIKPAFADVL